MAEAENTTSTMLFNHLFEACNILRGPINQDEYTLDLHRANVLA